MTFNTVGPWRDGSFWRSLGRRQVPSFEACININLRTIAENKYITLNSRSVALGCVHEPCFRFPHLTRINKQLLS